MPTPLFKEAYTVDEACQQAGDISRSFFYQLVREKKLRVRKLGNRTIVLREDLLGCLQNLP